MPSLLERTRHIELDLVPIPLGCAHPFHSDVQDSSAVSDEAYDDLFVRQTVEFNSFTRELQDRAITRSFAPAAAELRHQMHHRDRKIKAELAILQIQYPQTRFSTAKSLQPTLNECLLLAARNLSMGKQQRRDIAPQHAACPRFSAHTASKHALSVSIHLFQH
jgi:hypothetical protein